MLFHDRATIEGKARITREGYLVADAYVARANNIQDYLASELGLTDRAPNEVVRIFRPEAEVFAHDSISTASRLPITLNHPKQDVGAKNWRDLAKGETGEEIMRDGDRMRVPLRVTDAAAVTAVSTSHCEFSLGYAAELRMVAGVHDGQPYDGSLSSIRYNHLAAVPRARGGSDLRIVDERIPLQDQEKPTMKIKIGDAEVDLSDGAAVALAVGSLNTKLADAETKVGSLTAELSTATTTIQTKDGEIAALKQQVADAEVTPAKLQQLADARAKVITDAKAIAGDKLVTDGKSDAEIRRAAVAAKLGDAAVKDMADAGIEGAFATLLTVGDRKSDPLRQAIKDSPVQLGDEHAAYQAERAKRRAGISDAWRQPAESAAA